MPRTFRSSIFTFAKPFLMSVGPFSILGPLSFWDAFWPFNCAYRWHERYLIVIESDSYVSISFRFPTQVALLMLLFTTSVSMYTSSSCCMIFYQMLFTVVRWQSKLASEPWAFFGGFYSLIFWSLYSIAISFLVALKYRLLAYWHFISRVKC